MGASRTVKFLPILLLASCASIEVPEAPVVAQVEPALPKFVFSMEDTGPVTPTWWREFDDPMMVSLIETALKENRTLEAARANLAQVGGLIRAGPAGEILRDRHVRRTGTG